MIHKSVCLGTCAYMGGIMAVPEAFCWCWGQMRDFNASYMGGPDELIHYTRAQFSLHASARNFLKDEMRGDWLFMTDTDHVFEPDIVFKMVMLMEKYQTPVLSGIYRHKVLPHHPMLWMWHEERQGFVPLIECDNEASILRVDAAGAGALLIHRGVFERLAEVFPEEEPFDHRGKLGEDMSFFLRCREANIPVFATPLVQTDHLVARAITAADYQAEWYPTEPELVDTVFA